MANYAGVGFNNLYKMLLCERNGGHPKYTVVLVQFVNDIISNKDYIPKITVKFPFYNDYNASRGDVLCGIKGHDQHWNILDTYLSQDLDHAASIALDTIDTDKKLYTFVPVPFLQNDGSDTYNVYTFHTKREQSLKIINSLSSVVFNTLNIFTQVDFNVDRNDPDFEKLFRFDTSYTPILTALDEIVTVNQGSKENDPTQQATHKTFNVLEKYNQVISALPYRRVIWWNERLYLERGTSPLQATQQIFPVDIHTLNPTSIKKEAYRNNASKHNAVQMYLSKSGKSEDNTVKKRELAGFYKNGNPRYRTETIHNKKITPATFQKLGIYAISGDYGLMHTTPNDKGIFDFGIQSTSIVNILSKTITDNQDGNTVDPDQLAYSNIDLLWDRDDSSITINGNIRESWLKGLTITKKGVIK